MGRLKAVRKAKKIRIIDLAERSGICRQTIGLYELGRTSPTLDAIEDMMIALEITPDELFKNLKEE